MTPKAVMGRKPTVWSDELKQSIVAMIAREMTSREIAEATGLTRKQVQGGVTRFGLGPWKAKPGTRPNDTRHIPDTFADDWQGMTHKQLMNHYHKASNTISLWVKRLGLVREKAVRKSRAKPFKSRVGGADKAFGGSPDMVFRDTSAAGQAVDYLRKFSPVHKCTPSGRDDPQGSHYRRGSFVFSAVEIVQRAEEVRQIEARRNRAA